MGDPDDQSLSIHCTGKISNKVCSVPGKDGGRRIFPKVRNNSRIFAKVRCSSSHLLIMGKLQISGKEKDQEEKGMGGMPKKELSKIVNATNSSPLE